MVKGVLKRYVCYKLVRNGIIMIYLLYTHLWYEIISSFLLKQPH